MLWHRPIFLLILNSYVCFFERVIQLLYYYKEHKIVIWSVDLLMNTSKTSRLSTEYRFAVWVLLAVAVVVTAKRIFFGLDIDEEYSVALIYRLAKGDVLLKEMWEPHQTSAILAAPFEWVFMHITGKSEHLLIFLRLLGAAFGAGTSAYWYFTFKADFGKFPSLLTAIMIYLVLPKWIQSPEFNNMQIWLLICALCSLYAALHRDDPWHAFLTGVFLTLEVLAYPSCVSIFILFVVWAVVKARKLIVGLIVPPIVSFAGFMTWLLSKMSLGEAFKFLGYAFKDDAHSEALGSKLLGQLSDVPMLLLHLAVYVAIGVIVYLFFFRKSQDCDAVAVVAPTMVVAAFVDQFIRWVVFRDVLVGMGLSYVVLGACGCVLCTKMQKGADRSFSLLAMGSSLLAFLSVFLLTNLKVNAVFVHLLPGALVAVLAYSKKYAGSARRLAVAALGAMLFVSAFSQMWLLRINNQGTYEDIRLVRQKALYGAAKDVYLEYSDGFAANECYELLEGVVPEGSKVLYVGIHSMIYTLGDYEVCSPTTISTPVFGQNVVEYFGFNPEKVPEYVIVSKGLKEEYGVIKPEFKEWLSCCAPGGPVAENERVEVYRVTAR